MHEYDVVTTSPTVPSTKPRTPPRTFDANQWRINSSGQFVAVDDETVDSTTTSPSAKIVHHRQQLRTPQSIPDPSSVETSPSDGSVSDFVSSSSTISNTVIEGQHQMAPQRHSREISSETAGSGGSVSSANMHSQHRTSPQENPPLFPTLHDQHFAMAGGNHMLAAVRSPISVEDSHGEFGLRGIPQQQSSFRPRQVESQHLPFRPQPPSQQPQTRYNSLLSTQFNYPSSPSAQPVIGGVANVNGMHHHAQHQPHLGIGAGAGNPTAPGSMYDMGQLPTVQQQQQRVGNAGAGATGGQHHHSMSDPATLRDIAAQINLVQSMAGMNINPGVVQSPYGAAPNTAPMYYYQQVDPVYGAMLTRQHTGPANGGVAVGGAYASTIAQQQAINQRVLMPIGGGAGSGVGMDPIMLQQQQQQAAGGPSANNRKLGLYKTELCRSWEEKGSCRYGNKCQFAHGEDEIRQVPRHPKYKTEICRTFWVSGSCPYGKRCCFIHTELPETGKPPGADGKPVPPTSPTSNVGRERSHSIDSENDLPPVSLLQRIQANKRSSLSQQTQQETTPTTPTASSPPPQASRPNALRVDTSTVGGTGAKSAYPTFSHANPIGLTTPMAGAGGGEHHQIGGRPPSPGPVTAGPDLGRHTLPARADLDFRLGRGTSSVNSNRHSFNGTEVFNFNTFSASPANGRPTSGSSSSSPFASLSGTPDPSSTSKNGNNGVSMTSGTGGGGHTRSGSAGNWPNLSRNSFMSVNTRTILPSPGGGGGNNGEVTSPWAAPELTVGSSRRGERTWI